MLADVDGVRLDVYAERREITADEACGRVWWNGFGGLEAAFIRFAPTGETQFNEDTGRTEKLYLMTQWSCRHPRGKVWPKMRDVTVEDLASTFTEVPEKDEEVG